MTKRRERKEQEVEAFVRQHLPSLADQRDMGLEESLPGGTSEVDERPWWQEGRGRLEGDARVPSEDVSEPVRISQSHPGGGARSVLIESGHPCDRCSHTLKRHFGPADKDFMRLGSGCAITGCMCDGFFPLPK